MIAAARRVLEHEAARLRRRLAQLSDPGPLMRGDEGDLSAHEEARDVLEGSREVVAGRLRRFETAIARMDAGTYGKCLACGEAIPAGRLKAIPEVERCVPCQVQLEQGDRGRTARLEHDPWLDEGGEGGA